MVEPKEGVYISTIATIINDEMITNCDVENKTELKKVIYTLETITPH